MQIRVRLLGSLRQPTAPTEMKYEVPEGATISTLIKRILIDYQSLTGVLFSLGNLVMLGGVEIGNLDGFETLLSDGDEVVFTPVTHGGH